MQKIGNISTRRELTADDYIAGILAGDRTILARAITLIESQTRGDEEQAQEILQRLLPHTGKARRIGISGAPGVGKSTFIEAFGCHLTGKGLKLAVLTIDPSSVISGGSILGDKTRMERLSQESKAFIRPSPAGGSLGGVARRTRETMLLCEAAGFEIIIVESVGVGQAEVTLRSMVDFFLLLLLPGAGDELQGIKKGIMEIADGILITKADGENRLAAQRARLEQEAALRCLLPATPGWRTQAFLSSAQTGEGIADIWARIETFYSGLEPKGVIAERRRQQTLDWIGDLVRDGLQRRFYDDPRVQQELPQARRSVLRRDQTAVQAAAVLLAAHAGNSNHTKNMIKQIDHLGIAVRSLDQAVPFYENALGLKCEHREEVPSQKVRTAFFSVGEIHLELLEPMDPQSPIAKFLEKNPAGGIHHIAFQTDNIEGQLKQAAAAGVTLINEKPTDGANGKLVAFLHPKSTFGTLTEFCATKPN